MHRLTYTATREFAAPPEAVYVSMLVHQVDREKRDDYGALLSMTVIHGAPGEAGYQIAARHNWGEVDLEFSELTLAVTPGVMLRVNARPERYLRLNPSLRLPAIGSAGPPTDLEQAFAKDFGNPPPETETQFDLKRTETGTELAVTIETLAQVKPGWFGRWLWGKQAKKTAKATFTRVTAALG